MGSKKITSTKGKSIGSITHCARCGEDHAEVIFRRFHSPVEDEDGTLWEWWAICPKTKEPILMRQISSEKQEDSKDG